jgi:hypothetical protein
MAKKLAAAPAPAPTAELPEVDDTVVDDDALPPWPGSELDDEPEADAPAEPKAPVAPAPATPAPEGTDATAPADDPGGSSPAPAPASPAQADPAAAPAAPALGPSQRALIRLGWDASQVAAISEEQAVELMAAEVERSQQTLVAHQPFIQLGQAAQQHWSQIAPILSGQGQQPAAPPEATKKPGVAAALKKKLEALGPEPEYDAMWERVGLQTDGASYFAPPNASHLQSYADKLNAHRKWHSKRQELILSELPTALEQLESAERAPAGLTQADFERELQKREQERELRGFVAKVQNDCTWLFQRDASGNVLVHPATKQPIPTNLGRQYLGYCNYAFQQGMVDPRAQHNFAMLALGREIETQRAPVDQKVPVVPDSAPASSVAAATAAAPVLKGQQRGKAIRSPIAPVAAGATPAAPTRPPSLGEMLQQRLGALPDEAFDAPDDDGQ